MSIERFPSQTILRLGQSDKGNWKINWTTVFQNSLYFSKPMFTEEKSQQLSTNRRVFSVSLYYFTKLFFNFKIFYHLLYENYQDNHIFLSNEGRYLDSKPSRCKRFFPSVFLKPNFLQISWSEWFFHFLEIYSFATISWSYQTCKLSIWWGEHAVKGSGSLE